MALADNYLVTGCADRTIKVGNIDDEKIRSMIERLIPKTYCFPASCSCYQIWR